MELLYVYIHRYRNFKKQGIVFSNKFNVSYEDGKETISISRNENFINIYPNNIVGINSALGKNASGKTSLLDLIGKRIDSRHKYNEIWEEDKSDPHKEFNIFHIEPSNGLDDIKLSASYFLIYSYGQDSDGNNLFVFESPDPMSYIHTFINSDILTKKNSEFGPQIDYFLSKGWFSCVFKIEDGFLLYLNDTQDYKLTDNSSIQQNTAIILFKNDFQDVYRSFIDSSDEAKISVKRRHTTFKSKLLFNKVKFLVEQMNLDGGLYNNKEYYVVVDFNFNTPPFKDSLTDFDDFDNIVKKYSRLDLSVVSLNQKAILNFLYGYVCYAFQSIGLGNDKANVEQLPKLEKDSNDFDSIKKYYYNCITILFNQLNNLENISIKEIEKATESFIDFFEGASNNNIEIQILKNSIRIKLNKESKIEFCEPFFTHCLDEDTIKNIQQTDSVMQKYISSKIEYLSDGEIANLEMYIAIHEQLAHFAKEKKKYILLMDEVERAMHPEMCRMLITDLINFLNQYDGKSFQLILSSHSPFIASDLTKENIICLSYDNCHNIVAVNPIENTFGQNIHSILKNEFFLENTKGEYSTKRIIEVSNWLTTTTSVSELIKMMNASGWIKEISSISDAKSYLENIISKIGESLLRKCLCDLMENHKLFSEDIDEQIEFYKRKIEDLEKKKGSEQSDKDKVE